MSPLRAIARPMLASMFVAGGLDALRNPGPKAGASRDVLEPLLDALPVELPDDPEQIVRTNGAVQVVAGFLLATGRLPRLSALVLAASLVPTTLAGHRFWEADDEQVRTQQRIHFVKNVSMLGGLLIAAADTGGRPSLAYLARRTCRRASQRSAQALDALPIG